MINKASGGEASPQGGRDHGSRLRNSPSATFQIDFRKLGCPMSKMQDYQVRVRYPELKEFLNWEGWPATMGLANRWRVGEVVHFLKENGPVVHTGNASGLVREMMLARDDVCAVREMSPQLWSNFWGEVAGLKSSTRSYVWDPPFVLREMNGKKTKRVELNPAAKLPPNPLEAFARHQETARANQALRDERQADAGASVAAPAAATVAKSDPLPEHGADAARLKMLLGLDAKEAVKVAPRPVRAPEPAATMMKPVEPPLFVNDEATIVVPPERAVLDVDELLAPPVRDPFLVEPAPLRGLADELAAVGGRSLVDNARMLLALAGDMLTQAFMAEAALPPSGPDEGTVKERLGDALAEADRLRRKLQAAETQRAQHEAYARRTEAALRAERERADILDGNVQRLLKGEKAENTAALKGAQKFLAEKPRVPAG